MRTEKQAKSPVADSETNDSARYSQRSSAVLKIHVKKNKNSLR